MAPRIIAIVNAGLQFDLSESRHTCPLELMLQW